MNRILQPQDSPAAMAHVAGGSAEPQITGTVSFFQRMNGTLVIADISGLPIGSETDPCTARVFGFHIHAGESCAGTDFEDSDGHFDLTHCPHPYHAGDLPPLFGNKDGRAYLALLTDRFLIPDIIGRTVIIHNDPDDFTTQPSGNAGTKIACGVIRPI